jgi:putative Ca2+/H+ antiporter (TMEM165/GDT1 family)
MLARRGASVDGKRGGIVVSTTGLLRYAPPAAPGAAPMEPILSSFLLVAVSEMGDKTQLLAFSLASRYRRPWVVMAGILVATILNHALAAGVGTWVSEHVPPRVMAGVLAATFIGFGLWTLKPDTLEEAKGPSRLGPFLTTVVLFFLAEMADKTQLATVALAARYQSVVLVTVGTTLGMLAADGLAVFLGEKLAARLPMRWIRAGAAALFFLFGAVSLWSALRGG